MYSVLGDKERQEKIRQENPRRDHCPILFRNPWGCINFNIRPEAERASWDICPMNPFFYRDALDSLGRPARDKIPEAWHGKKPLLDSNTLMKNSDGNRALLYKAKEMARAISFGAMDSSKLTSEQYTLSMFGDEILAIERMRLSAKMVASELAPIMSKMLGG